MEQAGMELLKTSPALGLMALFAWVLLSIVKQVITNNHELMKSTFDAILTKVAAIDERTKTWTEHLMGDDKGKGGG